MNTPVKFEIAKLLKEKRFDKPTQKAYIGNDNLFVNFEQSYGESEFFFDADDFYENWNKKGWVFNRNGEGCFGCKLDNIKYFEAYAAPTIAEVVMWLYEKHNVYIHISPHGDDEETSFKDCKWWFSIYKDKLYNLQGGSKVTEGIEDFNSMIEVYKAAIEYTLTKLI